MIVEERSAGMAAPSLASTGPVTAPTIPAETLARLLARAGDQIAAGNFVAAAATTEHAASLYPRHVAPRRLPSRAAFARGEWANAVCLARDALVDFPDDTELLKSGYRAALRTNVDDRHHFVERLVAIGHQPARYLLALANLKIDRMEGKEALRLLDAAVEHGADPRLVKVARARAAGGIGDWTLAETLWTEILDVSSEKSSPTRAQVQRNLARAQLHRTSEVRTANLPVADPAAPIEAPTLFRTEADDLTCLRIPDARDVLLRFGALATMMGIARPKLSLSSRIHGINMVSVRDPRRSMTLRGLPTLGADFEATVAGFRALFECWGIENIYVSGASGGGYPALRYATALGARRVLLLSAGLTPNGVDSPFADRMMGSLSGLFVDARTLLQTVPRPPEVIAAFSTGSPRDRAQAEYLADLPNVTLVEVPGEARQLDPEKAQSLFDRLLADSHARTTAAAAAAEAAATAAEPATTA